MAVRFASSSSSALIAREAIKARAEQRLKCLHSMSPSRVRAGDSIQVHVCFGGNRVRETRQALMQAHLSLSALESAGHFLSDATGHLGRVGIIAKSGRSDAGAKQDLDESLEQIKQAIHGAEFEGMKLLDGTDLSVPLPGGKTFNIVIGGTDIHNLPGILTGEQGGNGLNLDKPEHNHRVLQRATRMIAMALSEISLQAGQVASLIEDLDMQLEEAVANYGAPEQPLSDATTCALAIQHTPEVATKAQATLSVSTIQRLLNE